MPIHPDLDPPYPPDWRDRAHPSRALSDDAHPRAALPTLADLFCH